MSLSRAFWILTLLAALGGDDLGSRQIPIHLGPAQHIGNPWNGGAGNCGTP